MFYKIDQANVASLIVSYELSRMVAISGKSYSGRDFVKHCLMKAADIVCPQKAQLFKNISLTRNTVAGRIDEMALDLK